VETKLGLVQISCGSENMLKVSKAVRLTHEGSDLGAQIVCHQELFDTDLFRRYKR